MGWVARGRTEMVAMQGMEVGGGENAFSSQPNSPKRLLLNPSHTQPTVSQTQPFLRQDTKVKVTPKRETSRSLRLMLTSKRWVGVRSRWNL